MAVTTAHVSVEEYLAADYSPDCDYVDGELLERNMGEWDHGAWIFPPDSEIEAEDAVLRAGAFEVPLAELFEQLS